MKLTEYDHNRWAHIVRKVWFMKSTRSFCKWRKKDKVIGKKKSAKRQG